MHLLAEGRYRVRFAESDADLRAAQRLRYQAFRPAGASDGRDADRFDPRWRHLLIESSACGRLVSTLRFTSLQPGDLAESYSAQFYGLSRLAGYPGRMIEIGRFCMDRSCHDPDILRLAWGALAGIVERADAGLLFGCCSLPGTDPACHLDAFALLKARHLAPPRWRPTVKAPHVYQYGARLRREADPRQALRTMPALLKSYLAMGGWVSDHAVIDADLDRIHVFTGLEVAAVPPNRARLLRGLAR